MAKIHKVIVVTALFLIQIISVNAQLTYGSIVRLKHANTGKYLGGIAGTKYSHQNSSQQFALACFDQSAVPAGQLQWKIVGSVPSGQVVTSGDVVQLQSVAYGYYVAIQNIAGGAWPALSPATGQREVCGSSIISPMNDWLFYYGYAIGGTNNGVFAKHKYGIDTGNGDWRLHSHPDSYVLNGVTYQEVTSFNSYDSNDWFVYELVTPGAAEARPSVTQLSDLALGGTDVTAPEAVPSVLLVTSGLAQATLSITQLSDLALGGLDVTLPEAVPSVLFIISAIAKFEQSITSAQLANGYDAQKKQIQDLMAGSSVYGSAYIPSVGAKTVFTNLLKGTFDGRTILTSVQKTDLKALLTTAKTNILFDVTLAAEVDGWIAKIDKELSIAAFEQSVLAASANLPTTTADLFTKVQSLISGAIVYGDRQPSPAVQNAFAQMLQTLFNARTADQISQLKDVLTSASTGTLLNQDQQKIAATWVVTINNETVTNQTTTNQISQQPQTSTQPPTTPSSPSPIIVTLPTQASPVATTAITAAKASKKKGGAKAKAKATASTAAGKKKKK